MIQPEDHGKTLRVVGLISGGVGVVALGLGTYFALDARSAASDAESGTGTWDPSVQTRGRNAQRNARISLAVGGAAVVTGAVLYILGRSRASESSVAVTPKSDGASVTWFATF